jgi:hypothetical protein
MGMPKLVSCLILLASCSAPGSLYAQELEPRAYAALPKNLNVIALVYAYSYGDVLTDPALPISNLTIRAHTIGGAYVRTFGFLNKLARVQIAMPMVFLDGRAKIGDRDTSVARGGLGDPKIRIGINLTGSPPLDKKDFKQYTQKTIFGVSLVTSVPIGTYVSDRRVNISSHRWGFKPEVGVSKRFGRIYAETYAGIWFYTSNKEYFVDRTLKQHPVFNLQAHVAYYFTNRMMLSVNTVWFDGGQTLVDDVPQGALLSNWRIGGTWAFPIAKSQSIKLQMNVGAFTASGYDYNAYSVAYQCVF